MRVACSPTDAGQRCLTRIAAQRAGEMFYHWRSEQVHGWVFPSERGVKYQPSPLYFHEWCPFCGGRLPDLSLAYVRFLRALDDGEGAE